MDPVKKPPVVFADRVIRMFVDHSLGSDVVIEPRDFQVIRVVFRHCQGVWEKILSGDIVHTCLLERIITNWGKQPGRKRRSEGS